LIISLISAKIAGKTPEVIIDVGRDYPLKIRFKIAEGHGDVSYMLASQGSNLNRIWIFMYF